MPTIFDEARSAGPILGVSTSADDEIGPNYAPRYGSEPQAPSRKVPMSVVALIGIPLFLGVQKPKLPLLAAKRPADGTHVYDLSTRPNSDSAWRTRGTITVELTTLQQDGRAVVRRISTYADVGHGGVVDTTFALARTLAPLRERTHKPSGIIDYDFQHDVVTGVITTNGASRAIHEALPGPAFNSTDIDVIVRSLPLAVGYQARLPIYDPELGGYRFANLYVDSDARAGSPSGSSSKTWLVHVADGSLRIAYCVDRATRGLLSTTIVDVRRKSEARIALRPPAGTTVTSSASTWCTDS